MTSPFPLPFFFLFFFLGPAVTELGVCQANYLLMRLPPGKLEGRGPCGPVCNRARSWGDLGCQRRWQPWLHLCHLLSPKAAPGLWAG